MHGLMAASGEINYGEAPMTQREGCVVKNLKEETLVIRSSVSEFVGSVAE
jgi:hypothetical protein